MRRSRAPAPPARCRGAACAAKRVRAPAGGRLDRGQVAAAFRSERHLRRSGEAESGSGAGFAPLSRFWRADDGWVRTHGNYPWHREALLRALGTSADPESVAAAIAGRGAREVEDVVVGAGGVAAAVRSEAEWLVEPPGRAVAAAALVEGGVIDGAPPRRRAIGGWAAAGVGDQGARPDPGRIDAFCDTVPRRRAEAQESGPLVLFVPTGPGWPYYARPKQGPRSPVTPADVRAVRARQRELIIPESFEWIEQTAPEMAAAAADAGLEVRAHPLRCWPGPRRCRRCRPGITVRVVAPEDAELDRIWAVPAVAFGHPGTAAGEAGVAERDKIAADHDGGTIAMLRERLARGTRCWPPRSVRTARSRRAAARPWAAWRKSPAWACCPPTAARASAPR